MADGKVGIFQGRTPTGRTSSYSAVGELFLTKMLKNPNYRTTITLPQNMGVVSGFCDGPFAFQGKAEWKPMADVSQAEDAAAALYAVGAGFAGQATGQAHAQLSFKQVRATEMRYSGTPSPVFQIKLILPSYDANARRSPIDDVRLLMACVFPRYTDTEAAGAQLEAPLGYTVTYAGNQQNDAPVNTVTIRRGKFFRADGMLIQSVSSSFSQEVMEDGYPLYVEANIEFIPWRTPEYDTAMNWFGNFSN